MTSDRDQLPWCVVTGGAHGLGRAVVRALVDDGWNVAALDCDSEGLDALDAPADVTEGRLVIHAVDVRDRCAVSDAIASVRQDCGPIHGLVNNAGILRNRPVTEIAEDEWRDVIDVNLTGAFFVAQSVAQLMSKETIPGRIVNMGSITGKIPRWGEAAYCASKAGLSHLTRVMALELAQHHITVNTLSPGSADAGVLWEHFKGDQNAKSRVIGGDPEHFRLGIPLGRLTSEDDVVGAVRYLLSPQASHVTGQELFVDGGQSMF